MRALDMAVILCVLGCAPALADQAAWTEAFQSCLASEDGAESDTCLAVYTIACAGEGVDAGIDLSDGQCPDGETMLWEAEMNRIQAEAEERLKDYPGAVDALVASQSKWMEFGNLECEIARLTAGPDGAPDVAQAYCAMGLTAERVEDFAEILVVDRGEGGE